MKGKYVLELTATEVDDLYAIVREWLSDDVVRLFGRQDKIDTGLRFKDELRSLGATGE